jgi:hypothetical protein
MVKLKALRKKLDYQLGLPPESPTPRSGKGSLDIQKKPVVAKKSSNRMSINKTVEMNVKSSDINQKESSRKQ